MEDMKPQNWSDRRRCWNYMKEFVQQMEPMMDSLDQPDGNSWATRKMAVSLAGTIIVTLEQVKLLILSEQRVEEVRQSLLEGVEDDEEDHEGDEDEAEPTEMDTETSAPSPVPTSVPGLRFLPPECGSEPLDSWLASLTEGELWQECLRWGANRKFREVLSHIMEGHETLPGMYLAELTRVIQRARQAHLERKDPEQVWQDGWRDLLLEEVKGVFADRPDLLPITQSPIVFRDMIDPKLVLPPEGDARALPKKDRELAGFNLQMRTNKVGKAVWDLPSKTAVIRAALKEGVPPQLFLGLPPRGNCTYYKLQVLLLTDRLQKDHGQTETSRTSEAHAS